MSLTEMVVKLLGIILAVVGFALLLSVVGIDVFGVHVANIFLALVLGVAFLGAGIYIVRGGTVTL